MTINDNEKVELTQILYALQCIKSDIRLMGEELDSALADIEEVLKK